MKRAAITPSWKQVVAVPFLPRDDFAFGVLVGFHGKMIRAGCAFELQAIPLATSPICRTVGDDLMLAIFQWLESIGKYSLGIQLFKGFYIAALDELFVRHHFFK